MAPILSTEVRADQILGTTWATPADLITAVRVGLSTAGIELLIQTKRMTPAEVDRVIIPRKTLSNRKKIGSLTPDQSDRLVRVAKVIAAAEQTFVSKEKAMIWLRRPTTALNGEAPLSMLDTSEGSHQVEILLGRISHGLAA